MASDDGFREIQLNGKQLIFLFMATTVVAVVIFLCGVMVGRGVRNGPATAAIEPASAGPAAADTGAPVGTPAPASAAANAPAAPPAMPPAPPAEEVAPDSPAGGGTPPAQTSKKAPAPALGNLAGGKPAVQAAAQKPAAADSPAPAPSSAAADVPGEPPGDGLVVQVAALGERSQAEAIARRLISKGYAAYVLTPAAAGGMFRVRVGKFKEPREADAVKRRLEKEEQFKPWITR